MMRHCIVINLAPKLEIWEFARHTLVSCFREVVKKHGYVTVRRIVRDELPPSHKVSFS